MYSLKTALFQFMINSVAIGFVNFTTEAKEKKHSRTSPDVQFKVFSLTKQKDLEVTMNEMKTI